MPSVSVGGELCITSETMHHRITRILRLHPGDEFIVFDRAMQVTCVLRTLRGAREIDVQVLSKAHNKIMSPLITFAVPLLKRESLDAALYSLVEVGANAVQLVTTAKSQRRWGGDKEFSRLERIMIAAAEQSKHFAFPELYPPIPFDVWCDTMRNNPAQKFFFDPQVKPLLKTIYEVQNQLPKKLVLMVGPEGDLTDHEKNNLQDVDFAFCALPPTILRAQQAIAVGVGVFRSVFP